jgi:hypothetical protein
MHPSDTNHYDYYTVPKPSRRERDDSWSKKDIKGSLTMILKLSLACVLSSLFVALVVANAIALPPKKIAQPTGWVTIVFKNPH